MSSMSGGISCFSSATARHASSSSSRALLTTTFHMKSAPNASSGASTCRWRCRKDGLSDSFSSSAPSVHSEPPRNVVSDRRALRSTHVSYSGTVSSSSWSMVLSWCAGLGGGGVSGGESSLSRSVSDVPASSCGRSSSSGMWGMPPGGRKTAVGVVRCSGRGRRGRGRRSGKRAPGYVEGERVTGRVRCKLRTGRPPPGTKASGW
ncbi:unnamed protein product [Chondrus crispus]|uniref:Uncharacterized protein n=1 Tax=Chondrus crispus TaxID=2769 RepID=R7QUI8_CHOCR|nr:unnamed protein product [Chondrus crispus]CDF41146.1 unnamed protein product [Chondrus crispus]|eukprot:XP_005711440.1 unnamed protein product [Chondrus crispus]